MKPGGYPQPTPEKDAERDAHKAQADKLEEIIKQHFQGLRVDKWLARLKPDGIGPLQMMEPEAFNSLEIELLS